MGKANRIGHKSKNQIWVRPEITHQSWLKINDYARRNNIDFPTALDKAADLLTGKDTM